MLRQAVRAVDPARALTHFLTHHPDALRVAPPARAAAPSRVVVVGAGKAAAVMAAAAERVLGPRLSHGVVVTKYGHGRKTNRIRVLEAGHPIPDRAGEAAAQEVLDVVRGTTKHDLLIVLLSGGASSLLPAPAAGLTLEDKQRVTTALLKSGADIHEVNTVRKHLSAIKGGQLAAATKATVVSLILSDVLGDDFGSIGSGPTAPDPTTFADVQNIVRRYRLSATLPLHVRKHVTAGVRGTRAETPKAGAALFRRVTNHIIGNNQAAVDAVVRTAWRAKISPLMLTTTLTGDVRAAAEMFGALAHQVDGRGRPLQRPCCLIAGGELTVTVRGKGIGGRAQEFALAAARQIAGLRDTWVIGFGTDGTDGPTDAAGAVVDGTTWARATQRGLDPARALRQNNTYPLLKRLGQLIHTGPTGTNVNDLYLLLML